MVPKNVFTLKLKLWKHATVNFVLCSNIFCLIIISRLSSFYSKNHSHFYHFNPNSAVFSRNYLKTKQLCVDDLNAAKQHKLCSILNLNLKDSKLLQLIKSF